MSTTQHTSSIADRVRRYAAAASLVAFPALLVLDAALDPAGGCRNHHLAGPSGRLARAAPRSRA